jgi:hypothetical protein
MGRNYGYGLRINFKIKFFRNFKDKFQRNINYKYEEQCFTYL